jgi:hypothetical protein
MAAAGGPRNVARLRVGLVVAIILLMGGLVVLGVIFVRALRPAGAPPQARAVALEWVRSFYGFGPAGDEQLRVRTQRRRIRQRPGAGARDALQAGRRLRVPRPHGARR